MDLKIVLNMFKDKTTYLLMLAEGVVNFRLFFSPLNITFL